MRTRVQRRKNQLEDQHRVPCTRVIKIGTKKKSAKGVEYPEQLNGFLICHMNLDANNKPVIDYTAMEMLGATKEVVDKAVAAGRRGVGLPNELHFFIQANATRNGDEWEYPGFQEQYTCYDAEGKFCEGNGSRAKQRQPNKTVKDVICNPAGCADLDSGEQYCPYSINSQEKDKRQKMCNYQYSLFVSLFVPDEETGAPVPLNRSVGFGARYGLQSGSETCGMEILQELDAAANYLDGNIHEITGILYFGKKRKHYFGPGKQGKEVAIVPQVYMVLSPVGISQRKQENRLMLMEDRTFQSALPAPVKLLEENATIEDHEELEIVDADIHDGPEESPFDEAPLQPPQAAPEQHPSALDNVSDEDLADSLEAFVGDQLAAYARYTHGGEEHQIHDINWFFEGAQGVKDKARRQLLRGICQGLNDTPGTTFEIIVHKEATE